VSVCQVSVGVRSVCVACPLKDGAGLHEEGAQRMLEGGDRTVGVGEGGLEMGEDLCRRPLGRLGRYLGERAPPQQGRADLTLAPVEPFPDALPGFVAALAVGGADRGGDAAGDGALKEAPQSAGGQAQPSDLVGDPDAERPPAAATCLAVAAKDPPGAHGLSLGAALVKSPQETVPNERADNLAVRACRLFEPFRKRAPFLVAAVKPSLLTHSGLTKIVILPAWQKRGSGGV
jgi:hypothetical protein